MHRYVDPSTQCLHTVRLLTKTNSKPKWMDKVCHATALCLCCT